MVAHNCGRSPVGPSISVRSGCLPAPNQTLAAKRKTGSPRNLSVVFAPESFLRLAKDHAETSTASLDRPARPRSLIAAATDLCHPAFDKTADPLPRNAALPEAGDNPCSYTS